MLINANQSSPTSARAHADGADGYETSVGKALNLLNAFDASRAVLGVSELASRARLPKSTAHRLLGVLVQHGYVQRVGDRYVLADRVFELGNQVRICRPNGLRERAVPFMTELFAQTRETVHLAVLRNTEVLYIEKVFGYAAVLSGTTVGTRRPAYCTALGKAILAFADAETVEANVFGSMRRHTAYTITQPGQLLSSLQRIRDEGVATDFEEWRLGLTCLAAPLTEPATGRPVGAMSISSATTRGDIRRFTARLLHATSELSSHLFTPVAM